MGDDMDAPHEKKLQFSADANLADLLKALADSSYLPTISGSGEIWELKVNGAITCRVGKTMDNPTFFIPANSKLCDIGEPEESVKARLSYFPSSRNSSNKSHHTDT